MHGMPVGVRHLNHLRHVSKYSLQGVMILLWSLTFVQGVQSQCSISAALDIPDDATTSIQFFVSGLVDNNLASPTQGICGVEIDFMHEYVGDLTITLISPSGTMVQLIGPATTAITPTN